MLACDGFSSAEWASLGAKSRTVPQRQTIGFIGLGAMGEPMAHALLRAGYSVSSSAHRRRDALERLVAAGGREFRDPAGVASQSDVVITCVPDAPQVEEALFGDGGAVSGARPGATFVDMSTISPVVTQSVARRLEAAGYRFYDAPVSGGPARAATGTLTIMVGGDSGRFADIEPVLSAMGTPTLLGPAGMGETVKLVNQILIASIMLANAEALTFARNAGADVDAVRNVIGTATGANYLLENWLPKTWFTGSFEGGFAMDLLRKDVAAALDTARAMLLPMPVTALAYQFYTAQSALGDGARDYSAVVKMYERTIGK